MWSFPAIFAESDLSRMAPANQEARLVRSIIWIVDAPTPRQVAVGLLTGSERKRADTTALYLVLDRHSGGSTVSGNVIAQSPSGNGQELEWNIVSAGNGYFSFGNRVSGMVLDMNGGVGAQAGFAVQEPQNSSSFTQQWQIVPVY